MVNQYNNWYVRIQFEVNWLGDFMLFPKRGWQYSSAFFFLASFLQWCRIHLFGCCSPLIPVEGITRIKVFSKSSLVLPNHHFFGYPQDWFPPGSYQGQFFATVFFTLMVMCPYTWDVFLTFYLNCCCSHLFPFMIIPDEVKPYDTADQHTFISIVWKAAHADQYSEP